MLASCWLCRLSLKRICGYVGRCGVGEVCRTAHLRYPKLIKTALWLVTSYIWSRVVSCLVVVCVVRDVRVVSCDF
jgi:hypothetical protein